MIWYTQDHVWLDVPDTKDLPILVGITSRGNEAVDGIQFVDVIDNKLSVESTKAVYEFKLPVDGRLMLLGNTVAYDTDAVRGNALVAVPTWYSVDTSSLLESDPE